MLAISATGLSVYYHMKSGNVYKREDMSTKLRVVSLSIAFASVDAFGSLGT